MDCLTILAQTVEASSSAASQTFDPINFVWSHITQLNLLEALTFVSFGTVCLFYGWRVFKILVTISFSLIGLFAGIKINELLVGGNNIWLGIICMAICAFFSVPLMRWGVSLLGAAAGGFLTGGAWYAAELPMQYIWAGVIIGVIAGGMISFIIFRIAVMLFTSLGGSILVLVGVLAVIYQYLGVADQLKDLIFTNKWFMPAALLIPMGVGLFLQNKLIKGSQNWDL